MQRLSKADVIFIAIILSVTTITALGFFKLVPLWSLFPTLVLVIGFIELSYLIIFEKEEQT